MVEEKTLPVDDLLLDREVISDNNWNTLCEILGCDPIDTIRIEIPKDSIIIDIPYRGEGHA